MSFWDRIRGKQPNFSYVLNYGGSIPPERTAEGFLKAYGEIGWLFAVVSKIAVGVSDVKWRLYKGDERSGRSAVSSHPILKLLDYVNPFMTGAEFIELTQIYIDLVGECFWVLNFNRLKEPAEIWIPSPSKMSVIPSKDKFIAGYVYQIGKNKTPLETREVIHFKLPNPLNQYRGLGATQALAVDLDTEQDAGLWNRIFFHNSARPDLFFIPEGNFSKEQRDEFRTKYKERYQGISKAHQAALVEGIKEIKQIGITQKDMDFANLRKMNRDNILGAFGMPRSVMGITEDVNRANAEAGEYTFKADVVKPRLNRIKNKLNEQLIPLFRKSENLELDYDEVVPETIEQKMLLAESGMRAGYLTIDEARQLRGLDKLPNGAGEVLLVPLNLIPTPIKGKPIPPTGEMPKSYVLCGDNSLKSDIDSAKHKSLTLDQKKIRWEAYAQKTARQEELFKKTFTTLFNEQKTETIKRLKETKNLDESIFISDETFDKTANAFNPVIELVYTSGYEDALDTKAIKQLDQFALGWIKARSLLLAKNLNETTLKELRAALAEGFAEGESIKKLTNRIEGYFSDNEQRRAEMIARTETIAANNEGALHRYEEYGIEKSEFYPAPDACDECQALIGEYNTKESHGIIPVHPFCRCVWQAVI
jgi:HK97 family phage portal protein